MKAFNSVLLALGALALSAVIDVAAQPLRGMMGTKDDPFHVPVAMNHPSNVSWEQTSGVSCPGFVIASNTLDQTDHGALEGYFAVGKAFDGMLRPEDPRFHWLKTLRGKPVDIVIRVRETPKLEKLK